MVALRHRLAAPAALTLGSVVIALLTTGGDLSNPPQQAPTAWVDVGMLLLGMAAVGPRLITPTAGAPGPAGLVTLAAFAIFTGLSALSTLWSVAPDQSWEESGRTLAYLGAFAGAAMLAARWRASQVSAGVLATLTIGALAIAVWALGVKALDLPFYGQPSYGRLLGPFGYWNATGLVGALTLPGCLLASTRPDLTPLRRGLALAGFGLGATVVLLSYSRSALLAGLLGLLVLLAGVRRRRAVALAGLGLVGVAPAWIDALATPTLSGDGAGSIYGATAHLHRGGAELGFGLLLLAGIGLLTAGGAAASARWDRRPLNRRGQRIWDRGICLLAGAAVLAVLGFLLLNHRGPGGEISHLWNGLVSAHAGVGDGANRLVAIGSSRPSYWHQAFAVGEHHLLGGAGAGAFYPAFLRYGSANLTPVGQGAHHAHSFVMETFASLGLAGIVVMIGLFAAWWWAVAGALRSPAPPAATPVPQAGGERHARWGLLALVVAFGTSSAIDWTWSFPGVAFPALVAAGWLTGLAPRVPAGPTRSRPVTAQKLRDRPAAILGLSALAAVALALAWVSLAPLRSVQSATASLAAQVRGDGPTALADARASVTEDPVSADAEIRLASVLAAYRDPAGAEAALRAATRRQPENPQPWFLLGRYELCRGDLPASLDPLRRAIMLDITDAYSQVYFLKAAREHQAAGMCGPVR